MQLDMDALIEDTAMVTIGLRRAHVDEADDAPYALAALANALHTQAVLFLSELTGGNQETAARTLMQASIDAA